MQVRALAQASDCNRKKMLMPSSVYGARTIHPLMAHAASATGSLPAGPAQSGAVGPLGSELTVLPYLATTLEFGKTTFAFHP